MEVTILEPSLHQLMLKVADLVRSGYYVKSAMQIGWTYEAILTEEDPDAEGEVKEAAKLTPAERMAKARAARGK